MSTSRLIALAVLVGLTGCSTSTAPNDAVVTSWRTPPIPSGGATTLTLNTASDQVTGTGQDYGLMGVPSGTFSVTGSAARGVLHLTMTYTNGATARYDATLATTQLAGTWTPGTQPQYARTFTRQ